MDNEMTMILTKSRMTGDDINLVIEMVDKESANSVYRRCAEEFNFRIAQVDGNVYSIAKELAPVFGYANQESVSKVVSKHQVGTLAITSFIQNGQSQIRQDLLLSQRDYSTQLINYRGFLTIALEGQGEHCDKLREYLLNSAGRYSCLSGNRDDCN